MDVVATINTAPEGATVKIPKGSYTIEPKIKPRRGVTLDLRGVTLKVASQSVSNYALITVEKANITIRGGTLVGDRGTHKGSSGAHGYGIFVKKGASNILIEDVISTKMWGDGIMIAGGKNITLRKVTGDNNRRQGLSICDGTDIRVLDSVFKNTAGTPPQAGIDIEPWEKTQLVSGVTISGCQILNNKGHGITINAERAPIRKVKVEKCTIKGNGKYPLNYWGWSKVTQTLAKMGLYRPTSIAIA